MPLPADDTVPELLGHSASAQRWCVASGGELRDGARINSEVRRSAAALIDVGVKPGDRVAVWAANSPEWITFALAAMSAGAVVVPLSSRSPIAEARELVERAGCVAAGAASSFRDRGLAADLVGVLNGPVVALGPERVDGTIPWQELVGHAAGGDRVDERLAGLGPDDSALVLFTSGSTGRPKGVVLRHGALVTTTRSWVEVVGLGPDDRYPIVNPLAHIGGFKTGLVAAMVAGATSYPIGLYDAEAVLDLIHREKLTVMQAPPTVFQDLIDITRRDGRGPTSLRVVATGSALIRPQLVRDIGTVLGVAEIVTAYGLTENTGVVTMTRRDDSLETTCATSGRPVPGVSVRIHSAAAPSATSETTGEILVAGAGLMAGYLDDPDATALALQDGWLHTGDVGWLDGDGNLHITGRIKDLVIVGGFNVSPAEVEDVLVAHPDIATAAVIGAQHPRLGEVPVAFVVPAAGRVPDTTELLDKCRAQLASYKVPREIRVVDTLPRNAVGKVDRLALRHAVLAPKAGAAMEEGAT